MSDSKSVKFPSIPLLSLTSPETLRRCVEYGNQDNSGSDIQFPTIFISSYPKSGTTWMQAIVYNLLTKGNHPKFQHISHFSPFFEIDNTWEEPPSKSIKKLYDDNHRNKLYHRVFNTHLPWHLMPKGDNIKNIYVVRNGKDVAVSFYHHLSNQDDADNFNGTFSEFLTRFLSGNMVYGRWIEHVKGYLGASESLSEMEGSRSSLLIVRYEDLISNLAAETWRISKFLGLDLSLMDIENIVPNVTFDFMKQNKMQFEPISVPWKAGFEFIRNGRPGDNKVVFSEEDHSCFINAIEEVLSEVQVDNLVYNFMKEWNIM